MKTFLIGFLFASFWLSCSPKYGIAGAKTFVRESVAGTIRADDNGRPVESGIRREHLLFIETDTTRARPQLDHAWVHQKSFSVQWVEMRPPFYPIGETTDGKQVILTPKSGNRLWQLVLTPAPEATVSDSSRKAKIAREPILLTGVWEEKNFSYSMPEPKPLAPIPYQ